MLHVNRKKTTKNVVEEKHLRRFTTFENMDAQQLQVMALNAEVRSYPSDRILFKRGDNDKYMYFLLVGELELASRATGIVRLKAGTREAAAPVSDILPRRVQARTTRPTTVLRIDRQLVDFATEVPLKSGSYEVQELAEPEESDWIGRFLCSINTTRIPPRNIQQLLMSIREIPVARGENVIAQNSNDEHYYIIKEGRCAVSRYSRNYGEVRLAELGAGAGFGEEALITRGKRNATVTMLDEGILMRLPARDFLQLLVRPIVDLYTWGEAEKMVGKGARFLDVREKREGKRQLAGALALPMSRLRSRLHTLQADTSWVVVCDDGRLSAAASFLLTQQGIENYVLMGGVRNIPDEASLASSGGSTIPGLTVAARRDPGSRTRALEERNKAEQEIDQLKNDLARQRRAALRRQLQQTTGSNLELAQNDYNMDYGTANTATPVSPMPVEAAAAAPVEQAPKPVTPALTPEPRDIRPQAASVRVQTGARPAKRRAPTQLRQEAKMPWLKYALILAAASTALSTVAIIAQYFGVF